MHTDSKSILALGCGLRAISPPPGLPLVGYGKRINQGISLDLCVRAALVGHAASATPSAALLVLDTCCVSAGMVSQLRERAAEAVPGLDPAAVLVSATHTHSGPALCVRRDSTPDAAHVQSVIGAVGEAVAQAWRERRPVSARVGLSEARLGHNRRLVDPSGHATNEWRDPEGRHTGYFNPTLRFAVFDDMETHKPLLILSCYGCHPVVLGPKNLLVSADFPGFLVRALESRTGAKMAIHVTGAAANINPRECIFEDSERARTMGATLAQLLIASLAQARPIAVHPIRSVSVPLSLRLKPDAALHQPDRAANRLDGRTITTEVQALRLGELALLAAPGELFAETGVALENTSPFAHTFVVGYANDNLGYLTTDAAFREGGYEAQAAISEDIERPLLAVARRALVEASG